MRLDKWLLGAAAAVAMMPQAAHAEWRRAETGHFIVYSDGSERGLRDYAAKLERFDALMRGQFGLASTAGERKLRVYLVGGPSDLREVRPNVARGTGGFYSASERDVFAVLQRGIDDDILLHEYAHHFMYQNFPGFYPGWFTEGFAEFFMTATVDERGKATIGNRNPGRQAQLVRESWLPIDQLLVRRPLDFRDREARQAFYAQSWLLTHYMLQDGDRRRRLDAYLQATARGMAPVEALGVHFGQTPEQLGGALRDYLNGTMPFIELQTPATTPAIQMSSLPASADKVLLTTLNLHYPQEEEIQSQLLADVRAAAAAWPQDPLALNALAQAELAWGEAAAGEAALTRVLETDPVNVEALRLMAEARMRAGDEVDDQERRVILYRQARAFLARAIAADPSDYRLFAALGRSRRGFPGYPDDNDVETWRLAASLAPQVMSIRGEAGDVMFQRGRLDEAEVLLSPVANNPHGGSNAEQARELLARIAERREPPAS
jgi:Tfp pilus assembly protein PilF